MAAPTIASLFDIETGYESALANYFGNVNASWQILTPQTRANAVTSTDFLKTPRITISASVASWGDQVAYQNGVQYYCAPTLQLHLAAATNRDSTAQNHGLFRGSIRQAMLGVTQSLNANAVGYYQTVDVKESSSTQGIDTENEEIVTNLNYEVRAFIPPSSWP